MKDVGRLKERLIVSLRLSLMAANICDAWSLIGVLMEAGIEVPYDDLVIAIADAGLAEKVIAAVTAGDD